MSEQQPQEQGTKRRAGSITRYTTLGKATTSEHSGVETPRSQNAQSLERLDAQESEVQSSQESKRLGAKTPNKRERHTIYLPPELSEWVKIRAVKTKREISELVTEAVERYREQEEGRDDERSS
jgi:hypothetical protein